MRQIAVAAIAAATLLGLSGQADAFSAFKGRFGKQAVCPQADVQVCARMFTLPEQEENGDRGDPGYLSGVLAHNKGDVSLRRNGSDEWVAEIVQTTDVSDSRAAYTCRDGEWMPTRAEQCHLSVKWGIRYGERLDMVWDLTNGAGSFHSSSKLHGAQGTFRHVAPSLNPGVVCADGGDVHFQVVRVRTWSKSFGTGKDTTMDHASLQTPSCANGFRGMVRAWDTSRDAPNYDWDVTGDILYRVTFE